MPLLKTFEAAGKGHFDNHNAWNQETGEKDFHVNITAPEEAVILFDGLYLLHPEIAHVADPILYPDVPVAMCNERQRSETATETPNHI